MPQINNTFKLYVSLTGVVAAAVVAYARYGFKPELSLGFAALCVVAFTSTFDSLERYLFRKEQRRAESLKGVEYFVHAAFLRLTKELPADLLDVGVHVFFVRGCQKEQFHEKRFRFRPRPPSLFRFTPGKGVVGLCWTSKAFVVKNLVDEYAPYLKYTKEQWDALAPAKRYYLTFDEFVRTSKNAVLIAAAPILNPRDGTYLGCVSADTPPSYDTPANRATIQGILEVAASGILNLPVF